MSRKRCFSTPLEQVRQSLCSIRTTRYILSFVSPPEGRPLDLASFMQNFGRDDIFEVRHIPNETQWNYENNEEPVCTAVDRVFDGYAFRCFPNGGEGPDRASRRCPDLGVQDSFARQRAVEPHGLPTCRTQTASPRALHS